MEQNHAVGPGRDHRVRPDVRDRLPGDRPLPDDSAERWAGRSAARPATTADAELIGYLERAVEALLRCWLDHSRRVRLSVLEAVADESRWRTLARAFIETYGDEPVHPEVHDAGQPSRAIRTRASTSGSTALAEDPEQEEESD